MNGDSTIKYKGYRSPTLHLVLLIFAVGTALLWAGKIGETSWVTGILGMMSTYIGASSISKLSEAYMATRMPSAPAPAAPPTGVGQIP